MASLHLGCPLYVSDLLSALGLVHLPNFSVDQEETEDAPTGNAEEDNIGRAQEYVVRAYLETLWLPDVCCPTRP